LEKDRGIIIISKLGWKPNIYYVINKVNKQLGLIKYSFKYLKKPMYKSLVRPHLKYGALLWNPFRAGDIDYIERVQR
jgi:hypothetical protein